MYDPLVDQTIPSEHTCPESFWAQDRSTHTYQPLQKVHHTQVAIVGGGFTGLSAAYHLQKDFGIDCTVIEANQPGWGCSGRNGGFVLPGSGRLGIEQIAARWGEKTSHDVFNEFQDSVNTVDKLIDQGIECEKTEGGYLKLAHQPALLDKLHVQANMMSENYGDNIVAVSAKEIAQDYVRPEKNFGGVFYPKAFSVNPWLLCQGLGLKAKAEGAEIFGQTPLIRAQHHSGKHHLHTPNGEVIASTLLIATNAYTPRNLFSLTRDRTFPVISSIIVTAPLTQEQLKAINIKPGLMVMDTRPLKYYYRILPDNRVLFGGRGAVTGKKADDIQYQKALLQGLESTFPQLTGLKVDYFWSGWVAISLDDYPRIHHEKKTDILYSAGYCGAGLAFSIQAGHRLAQLYASPEVLPDLPFWQSPLKRFPLANMRRSALRAYYSWQALKRRIQME